MFRTFRGSALSLVGTAAALGPVAANAADEVNIYSDRQELLIRPLLDEVGFNAGPTNSLKVSVSVVPKDHGSAGRRTADGTRNTRLRSDTD